MLYLIFKWENVIMRKFIITSFFIFLLLSCKGNKTLVEQYNCDGLNEFSNEKYLSAIECFEKAIKIDNKNVVAYNGKANALYKLGKIEEAVEVYNKAITLNPNIISIYEKLGGSYIKLKNYDQAIDSFDNIIKIDKNSIDAYSNKGMVYNIIGKPEEAINSYSKMIEINSNDRYAIYCKGLILMQMSKYDEALVEFDKLLEFDDDDVDIKIYQTRGLLLSLLGKYVEAIESYNNGLKIDPNSKELNFNKAEALYNLGKYSEAIEFYNKTLKLEPNNNEAKIKRDESYKKISAEKRVKAIETPVKLAENNKKVTNETFKFNNKTTLSISEQKNLTYYYNSGVRLMEDGYYERALYCFNKALAIDSTKAELYHTKGLTLVFLDKLNEGNVCLKEAIKLDPNNKAYIDTFKMINFLLN